MSFQGYHGEVSPQVGNEIPGAEGGGQMMQLTQVQLAQIISSAVSQALTLFRSPDAQGICEMVSDGAGGLSLMI